VTFARAPIGRQTNSRPMIPSYGILDRIEPDPLPFPAGEPERGEQWAPGGAPPAGLAFLGCQGTLEAWLAPCPCCCRGWVPVLPLGDADPYAYRLAVEAGCSRGCEPPAVAWWHAWKMGDLPPPVPPDDRAERYARGAIRRLLAALPERPSLARLKAAAFWAGQWLAAGRLPTEPVADALLHAAVRAGLDEHVEALASAVTAGRAKPGRVPP
jgi:hypothetical protein